jgi:hypothetical protein
VFDPDELPGLREAIRECAESDRRILDQLRAEVRTLKPGVRSIRPRTTTAVSLVASDGGNNKLEFDPFYFQVVRVVDSQGKQECLEVVSPTTDTDQLSVRQFGSDGQPLTDVGRLMVDLGVKSRNLNELSHMIPSGNLVRTRPEDVSPSWVQVYRDIVEWAVLYRILTTRDFATHTLVVRDGLLRSKVFRGEYFAKMRELIDEAIVRIRKDSKRRVYLVGIAKHSKVLQRYLLSMALEDTMPGGDARFVDIPRELEMKAYKWSEWAKGSEEAAQGGEANKFVAGKMFFVRFGHRVFDPIWTVDLLESQVGDAQEVFGYLLADAINGFPVPYYPRCLQQAHEYAQVSGRPQAHPRSRTTGRRRRL